MDNGGTYTPRDHLLGRLPAALQDAADERSVLDHSYYEALVAEEELLVEEYAAGRLPPEDARVFESLCRIRPDLRDRVACERALPRVLEANAPRFVARPRLVLTDKWRTFAAIAAAIVLLLAATTLYLSRELSDQRSIALKQQRDWERRDAQQRDVIAQLEQRKFETPPRVQQTPKSSQSRPLETRQLAPLLASILIPPFTRGDANTPRFPIPAGMGRVQLQFNIGTDTNFTLYRIVVKAQGSVLARATAQPKVVSNYRIVAVPVPANFRGEERLQASVYGLTIGRAEELVEGYSFILVREGVP